SLLDMDGTVVQAREETQRRWSQTRIAYRLSQMAGALVPYAIWGAGPRQRPRLTGRGERVDPLLRCAFAGPPACAGCGRWRGAAGVRAAGVRSLRGRRYRARAGGGRDGAAGAPGR